MPSAIRTGRDLREHLDAWRREQTDGDAPTDDSLEDRIKAVLKHLNPWECLLGSDDLADVQALCGELPLIARDEDEDIVTVRLVDADMLVERYLKAPELAATLDAAAAEEKRRNIEWLRRQADEAKRPRVAMPLADGVALFEEVPKRIATDGEVNRLLRLASNHPDVIYADAFGGPAYTCDECGAYRTGSEARVRFRDGRRVCLSCLPTLEVGPAAAGDSDVAMLADAAADDGIPRTGRELFRWAKEQEQRYETGLLKYLNSWGKLNDFPGRMVDWDAHLVSLAYAEARRKLRIDGPTTIHVATLVQAVDDAPIASAPCSDCNGTGVSPDTIDGPEPDQAECLLCCGHGTVSSGLAALRLAVIARYAKPTIAVAQRADAAEFPHLAGIASEIGGQS